MSQENQQPVQESRTTWCFMGCFVLVLILLLVAAGVAVLAANFIAVPFHHPAPPITPAPVMTSTPGTPLGGMP
jgi:hypothetical protein